MIKLREQFQDKMIGSWLFAVGRLAALEAKLLSAAECRELLQAKSEDELRQQLLGRGYVGSDLSAMLQAALEADLQFLAESVPVAALGSVSILPHDAHNLKVCLKSRLPASQNPEVEDLERIFLSPCLYEARDFLEEIAYLVYGEERSLLNETGTKLMPPWVKAATAAAFQAWNERYDVAGIDLAVDRAKWQEEESLAQALDNPWYNAYLRLDRDLYNLACAVRLSALAYTPDCLGQYYAPASSLSLRDLQELASAQPASKALEANPRLARYGALAQFLDNYAAKAGAAQFAKAADALRLAQIKQAASSSAGAERVISYLLRRHYERLNLRLLSRCLQGELSGEQSLALLRSY